MNWILWNVLVAFGQVALLIIGLAFLMAAGYGVIGLVVWFKSRHIPIEGQEKR